MRLHHVSAAAEKRGAFAVVVSAEKLRAQINGVLAPLEIKATVTPGAPARALSLEEAVAELEELDEVLRAARAAVAL